MELLFLGGVFDEILEKELIEKSKSMIHNAANQFQFNLIDGLFELEISNMEILSAPFIGSFPKDYRDIRFKSKQGFYKNEVKCNYVGFNNIWGYRNLSRKSNLARCIKVFAIKKADDKVILIYSPHTPFLQAAVYAKKIDPSIHLCLVVPDLPQFMNLNENKSLLYNRLKKIDIKIFEKNLESIDSFVLLTEPMKNLLNLGNRPYVIVEGIINKKSISKENVITDFQSADIMTVVYTGTLNKKFGVVNLVEAFHNTNINNANLEICGRGDSEEIIRKYATKDKRIKFLGQLSNTEAVKLQKKATILVNPRQNNEEFTKYSFPSKNMEYLLTGRPVIAYKLDGIPDEYDDYFYYVEDDSTDALRKKILEVLALSNDERSDFGQNGRMFVLKHKDCQSMCLKIYNMIKDNM